MHSSEGAETIRHIQLVAGRRFSGLVEREQPTDIATARRVASSGFDTSGKTLAKWHHRKIRNARAEKSAAGFFMSEQLHDQRIAIVARNEQRRFAGEIRIRLGELAALDARSVCNSA
ncbi:hypothetical protein ABID58_004318 [Bradyrhizobium sp. S3.2.6]|uniref:hypothetical protein n=1 Tax=Bradyrhizobium sp. S3.2.6 TaxID=3156428 RepID=UPI00339B9148